MVSQQEIYNFLKETGYKLTVDDICIVFECCKKTLNNITPKMIENEIFFKGLKRELKFMRAPNGRQYVCYQYFVELEEKT